MNSNRVGGTPGGAAALDGTAPARSFYCIADRSFYLGAVALINSLRLVGHSERIVVLDCGLADSQRALLSREATIVDPESRGPLEPEILPILLRARAPLALPAKAMILLDADIIVVRELEPLFQEAESGKIVAFTDALDRRFSDRWQAELGTESMRQQSYVNTGLLGLPFQLGTRLLRRLEEVVPTVDLTRSFWTDGIPEDPFFFLDQDIFNGLLASEFRQDQLTVLSHRLAPHPPFPGLSFDEISLRCHYPDRTEAFLLHHVMRKPWLDPLPANVYSLLLTRLLVSDDLPLRPSLDEVPYRLRPSLVGSLSRRAIAMRSSLASNRRTLTSRIR